MHLASQQHAAQRSGPCSGGSRRTIVAPARANASQHQPSAGPVQHEQAPQGASRRQALVALLSATASMGVIGSARAEGTAPFLVTNGARGILAEEEERLFRLRQEKEGEARARLLEEKNKLEEESRQSMVGKLCATPFGVDIVGITEFVALVGALVGGVTARQRKEELERLNEQLRKINLGLRQQARAGTVYAPGLTYAPAPSSSTVGGDGGASTSNGNGNGGAPSPLRPRHAAAALSSRPSSSSPAVAAAGAATATAVLTSPRAAPAAVGVSVVSVEEEDMSPEQLQCRETMRLGKRLLKDGQGAAAMVRFEKALMLCKGTGDKVQERRAMRGLAAAARLQGQYRSAIKHLERVLEISNTVGEHTGDADAYGSIADNYTDLGDFEKAAFFYDKYIQRLNGDGSAV